MYLHAQESELQQGLVPKNDCLKTAYKSTAKSW